MTEFQPVENAPSSVKLDMTKFQPAGGAQTASNPGFLAMMQRIREAAAIEANPPGMPRALPQMEESILGDIGSAVNGQPVGSLPSPRGQMAQNTQPSPAAGAVTLGGALATAGGLAVPPITRLIAGNVLPGLEGEAAKQALRAWAAQGAELAVKIGIPLGGLHYILAELKGEKGGK
jgi:hypothetical protein